MPRSLRIIIPDLARHIHFIVVPEDKRGISVLFNTVFVMMIIYIMR